MCGLQPVHSAALGSPRLDSIDCHTIAAQLCTAIQAAQLGQAPVGGVRRQPALPARQSAVARQIWAHT